MIDVRERELCGYQGKSILERAEQEKCQENHGGQRGRGEVRAHVEQVRSKCEEPECVGRRLL